MRTPLLSSVLLLVSMTAAAAPALPAVTAVSETPPNRTGANDYLAGFIVGDGPATDGAQHCDGAAITTAPLGPTFPHGLLVVHDGENSPTVLDGDEPRENTNFKLVPLERVLGATGLRP